MRRNDFPEEEEVVGARPRPRSVAGRTCGPGRGFTLVEALLAAVLGLLGVGIYVGLHMAQSKTDYGLVARLSAMDDCRVAMELLRMEPFSLLAPTPGPLPIACMPYPTPSSLGLPAYAPGAWTATVRFAQVNYVSVPSGPSSGHPGHVVLVPGAAAPVAPSPFMALDSAQLAYSIAPHMENGFPVPQAVDIGVVATWREAGVPQSFRLVTVRTNSQMESWP